MSALGRWRYRRLLARMAGPKLLRAFAEEHPSAFFVEIGANDGDQHDHLRPLILAHDWRGIMVEPVPYVFERLRGNYAGVEGVACENVAIASVEGRLPFFHLPEVPADQRAGLPEWYDAIGSFSREAVLRHARDIPGLAERVVETEVEAITFEALLARHGSPRVDLVLIDTEGHDWAIVQAIDLEAHRPRVLVYEHFHLDPDDRAAARAHLHSHGYETMEEGFDTFAVHAGRDDALIRRFRSLRPAVPGISKHDE